MLSDFSLTIFQTTICTLTFCVEALWFAFRFFFDNISNNSRSSAVPARLVVICFQIFLWQYFKQPSSDPDQLQTGCDLLSDFSLTIFQTTFSVCFPPAPLLWFAFRFFFDNISNNVLNQVNTVLLVVICFQIFLWQYFKQRRMSRILRSKCCDLLSDFSLTIFQTTVPPLPVPSPPLWFAFRFFFDNISNNNIVSQCREAKLWFAFRFFFDNISNNWKWI